MYSKIKTSLSINNEENFSNSFIKNKKNSTIDELVFTAKKDVTNINKDIYDKVCAYEEPIYFDLEEKYRIKKLISDYTGDFLFFDNNLVYYYVNIDRVYGDSLTEKQKIVYAKRLREEDEKPKNARKILHSTPVIVDAEVATGLQISGQDEYIYDGECLQFYNEDMFDVYFPLKQFSYLKDEDGEFIIENDFSDDEKKEIIKTVSNFYADAKKNSLDYSDYFIEGIDECLDSLCFIYPDDESNSKIFGAYGITYTSNSKSTISIDASYFDTDYDEQLGTYTHELTHVLDGYNNYTDDIWFSSTDEWVDIYNQVKEKYFDTGLLTEYSFTIPCELLAESVTSFYENDSYSSCYNCEDLKAITIEVDDEEITLYDYLDSYLSRKKEQSFEIKSASLTECVKNLFHSF